ncbi:hemerythrin domain-containing protein [Jiella pelagia]|uniref:Hemerythrin domain-containing protein n=1 Tax=Jiella pelagia TaxID=2986949 RepID=A0ABY7BV25_9HYPH|nr:hemerythrin domain-containing protein [Jiella pelagia]WAP67178.1 hemerythrin domain-containing protein [Jiella pelagia]
MTFQPRSQSRDELATENSGNDPEARVEARIVALYPAETRNEAILSPVPGSVIDAAEGRGSLSVAAALSRELAAQRRLCDSLEAIADALPNDLDAQRTLHVARSIGPSIRRAHRFEEETIFPLLKRQSDTPSEMSSTLERLHFEHWEDESFGDELSEKLIDYVRARAADGRVGKPATLLRSDLRPVAAARFQDSGGRADPVAEALGYMLRGFFEGLRRHIAFEEEHLVPLLVEIGARR